ncbi:SHOCT domain-containing protein [Aeoliella mucimassa]|uniref:SHOCT domain-containing protein n=1 Tax=Aeoliella mucimassa TaxID=2527972 RepID=A0A518AIY7_9BACT|nr:SHOCT domain-containing protein [Aeoliella mucimassa]QDU54693.1 hypothetical protein Pan181_08760 [Aeoliella mucimassa]
MRTKLAAVLLVGLVTLPGCLAFSVGGGTKPQPTMADEIIALRKLRDRGTISASEFAMGKQTLLRNYQPESPTIINPAETQLATYPEPVDETTK